MASCWDSWYLKGLPFFSLWSALNQKLSRVRVVSVRPLQSPAFHDLTASRSGGTQGPERSLEVMSSRRGSV